MKSETVVHCSKCQEAIVSGEDLGFVCRGKRQSPSEYMQHRGVKVLVSQAQSEAYSERGRRIWMSFSLRSKMAHNRSGKGTGPRFRKRKVSLRKILEIVAANPGLSLTEMAKLAGLSRIGFYNHVRKLGDFSFKTHLSPARDPAREFAWLLTDRQLREWIASHPENFSAASAPDKPGSPTDEFLQFCMDNLDKRQLSPFEFASFILDLLRVLEKEPKWIAEIAAEIAAHKGVQTAFRLRARIFEMRAETAPPHGVSIRT